MVKVYAKTDAVWKGGRRIRKGRVYDLPDLDQKKPPKWARLVSSALPTGVFDKPQAPAPLTRAQAAGGAANQTRGQDVWGRPQLEEGPPEVVPAEAQAESVPAAVEPEKGKKGRT